MVITADGGLTPDNVAQFMSELEKLIDGGTCKVIVDCTKLSYVSSRALCKLLKEKSDLTERGGEIRLACVQGRVAKFGPREEIFRLAMHSVPGSLPEEGLTGPGNSKQQAG